MDIPGFAPANSFRTGSRIALAALLFCCAVLADFGSAGAASALRFKKSDVGEKKTGTDDPHPLALRRNDWLYRTLEVNYALLNTADLVTTFYGLDHGAREVNPLAVGYINNRAAAIAIKGGLTLGVLWGLRQAKKENRGAAIVALGALNLVYGIVVGNNIGVLLKLE